MLQSRYKKLKDFKELIGKYDPNGSSGWLFGNEYL